MSLELSNILGYDISDQGGAGDIFEAGDHADLRSDAVLEPVLDVVESGHVDGVSVALNLDLGRTAPALSRWNKTRRGVALKGKWLNCLRCI